MRSGVVRGEQLGGDQVQLQREEAASVSRRPGSDA